MSDIKLKKFVVIPCDAMNVMENRFVSEKEAVTEAESMCAKNGMAHYVVEMKAVASREDRPVKVQKL